MLSALNTILISMMIVWMKLKQVDIQTDRSTDRQTDRSTNWQTGGWYRWKEIDVIQMDIFENIWAWYKCDWNNQNQ